MNGQVFAETAILVYAIKRYVFAAVGFSFFTCCALVARDAGDNGIALTALYGGALFSCRNGFAADLMPKYSGIGEKRLASGEGMNIGAAYPDSFNL